MAVGDAVQIAPDVYKVVLEDEHEGVGHPHWTW